MVRTRYPRLSRSTIVQLARYPEPPVTNTVKFSGASPVEDEGGFDDGVLLSISAFRVPGYLSGRTNAACRDSTSSRYCPRAYTKRIIDPDIDESTRETATRYLALDPDRSADQALSCGRWNC